MSYIFSFEKLTVWIDSIELVKTIYSITLKFPSEEKGYYEIRTEVEKIANKLNALRKSQLNS